MGDAPLLGGRYRLGARLGGGGMADVYRAVDTRLERVVAAKVFRAGTDAVGRDRFVEEARTLAGLSHPGLVTVHDFSATEDEIYLIMELVAGRTLADVISAGPLPPQRVAELGGQLADVLAHVHGNGIVHRDVKPSNVLIAGAGQAFLADFGISRLADAAARMTSSGIIVGTATYMAPEQVSGAEVGYPADVYALGLVLLECVTGKVEYPGAGAESAVARLVRPPEVPLGMPSNLNRALLAMTADEPRRRPTAAQSAELLSGAATEVIAQVEPSPAPPPTQQLPAAEVRAETRRNLRPWLLIGAFAVVLVALIGYFSLPAPPAAPTLPPASGPAGVARLPEDLANLEGLVRQ
ncbi:serine/threonine-protein kinase [Saccharopolyspora sp. 5N708]|uniref:serine/threonine-protein kinase n=1 Tax=Saccharopolyspora sp. 5N708 TaxID=3457424 RepID=UPI003FD2F874